MAETGRPSGSIRFDAVEIDVDGHRLRVDGVEVAVERKAFAVLVLLAGQPGRLFSREDILEAVWGHSHVTPGVLNRVITLLRQALGESADAHRYLHTVHGVGYRFDATVQVEAAPAESPESSGLAQRAVPDPAAVAAAAPTEMQRGPDIIPLATIPSQLPRSRWPRMFIAGLLLVMAIAVYVWREMRPANPPSTRIEPALVVLPLRPVGDVQDERTLAEGLSEELITRLARIDGLHLISTTSARLAQSESLDLQQLADRLRVTHALEGSLRQAGQQLRIDLRLIELPGGRTVWAQDYDRNLADVFALQREIAQSVATKLALRLGLDEQQRPSGDPQLFRDYLEARRLLRESQDPSAKPNRADEILRSIIARDPSDARAHGLLALALTTRDAGFSDTQIGQPRRDTRDFDQAETEAKRALELAPDLVDAHVALANSACHAARWKTCMDLYRRALDLDPTNFTVRSAYAARLGALGYIEEALRESEIGLASEPLSYEANFQRGRLLDTLGRHDEARGMLDAAASLWPQQPWRVTYARWFNAVWRNDHAAASSLAENLPESSLYRASYIAVSEGLLDPTAWPRARALIVESERLSARMNFLHVLLPQVDAAHVIDGFEPMLREAFPSYYLFLWQRDYALLRNDPAFAVLLRRVGIIDYWNANGWPPQCRALGAGLTCD